MEETRHDRPGLALRRPATGLLAGCLLLAACNPDSGVPDGRTATRASVPDGPSILTTVGHLDEKPVNSIVARHGHFQLKMLDGLATLYVDGKPVGNPSSISSEPIQANVNIELMGVLELLKESVAWVVVTGGTACAATNYLVSLQTGQYPRVVTVEGCGDSGTMVRKGDKIVFEFIGDRFGTYQAGTLTMDQQPYLDMQM